MHGELPLNTDSLAENLMNSGKLEALIFVGFGLLIVVSLVSLFIFESPFARRVIGPCLLGSVLGLAIFAGFVTIGRQRREDPHKPTVVASMADEMSASALVVQLEAHGISARAIGGFTAGDIVCDVKVVVPHKDHELAMGVMQLIEEDSEMENL